MGIKSITNIMKSQSTKYLAGALLLTIGSASHAAVITYTDRTTWAGAGTVTFTEDFESYSTDTSFATTPLDVGPFTFSTVGTALAGRNMIDVSPFLFPGRPASFGDAYAEIFVEGALATDIIFDSPISGFFADFYAAGNTQELSLTLSFLGGGTTDLSVPGAGSSSQSFGFWSTTDAVTSIRFNNTVNDGFNIDNISGSAVPVPAAIWLFGSGLIGLIGIARRKQA